MKGIRSLYGLAVLSRAIGKFIDDPGTIMAIESIHQILLAPVLWVIAVPEAYCIGIIAGHDTLSTWMGVDCPKDHPTRRYAQRRVARYLGLAMQG